MTSTSASRCAVRTCRIATAGAAKARKRASEKLSPALKNGGLAAVTAAANVAAIRSFGGKGNSTAPTTKNARLCGVESARMKAVSIVEGRAFDTLIVPLRLPVPCTVMPSPLANLEQQIDALRETGASFWQRGWSLGTSSNYSVVVSREPLELLITASGKDKGKLTRTDFVRVDSHGKPTSPGQPKSSAETLLHIVAAQQPGIGAVLHTHSVWGTLLSDYFAPQDGFEISGFEMLKGLEGVTTHEHAQWVPIFENTQNIPDLAEQVREAFADASQPLRHGYLIRRHGLYTWGRDLDEARRHIEIFEFLFEVTARRLMLAGTLAAQV